MGLVRSTDQEHRYQLCDDEYCDRFPCRVYKEGRRNGYEDGYRIGWVDCYPQAFAEGLASCPGPHSGG